MRRKGAHPSLPSSMASCVTRGQRRQRNALAGQAGRKEGRSPMVDVTKISSLQLVGQLVPVTMWGEQYISSVNLACKATPIKNPRLRDDRWNMDAEVPRPARAELIILWFGQGSGRNWATSPWAAEGGAGGASRSLYNYRGHPAATPPIGSVDRRPARWGSVWPHFQFWRKRRKRGKRTFGRRR